MFTVPAALSAQSQTDDLANGGTVYSSIGMGIPVYGTSPFTDGMGLSGVALIDPYTINIANPAMWGLSQFGQGSLSLGFQGLDMSDNTGTARRNSFTVDRFQVQLPVIRSRFGVSVAFAPVTRSTYSLYTESTFQSEPGSGLEPIDVFDTIEGSGGINKIVFGAGYMLNTYLAVGYTGSIYFSSLSRQVTTVFDSDSFDNLDYTEDITGSGFGNQFGIYGHIPGLFISGDDLSTGATLTLPVSIASDRQALSYRNIDNRIQSVEIFEGSGYGAGNMELPLEFNLGLTYYPQRWIGFSSEYMKQQWSEAEFSYTSEPGQYYTDRTRIGMGVQYLPFIRDELASGLLANTKYSAGFSYDSGFLNIEGQKIETLMFHAGFGLLTPNTRNNTNHSSFDLSFNFGFRGTEAQNLVKETIWGVSLSLNLSEFMLQPSRFR